MTHSPYWLILTLVSTYLTPSLAATVIERRNAQGDLEKITLEAPLARIDRGDPNYYRLLNGTEKKSYSINAKDRKTVVIPFEGTPPPLPVDLPKPSDLPTVKAELVKPGEGPKVAGYPTVIYQVTADGYPCSEIYLSLEATKIPDLLEFLKASNQLTNSRKSKGIPQHPCQQAHDDLEGKIATLGIAMKMVIKGRDQEDHVLFEIVSVKTDETVPATMFAVPKDYQVFSEAEMIKQRREQMQKRMEEQPSRGD